MYQDIISAELKLWQSKLEKLALDIWANPEKPNAEHKACKWTAELLQEAGLRLPNPIGDTVSIIGALIVGQSAVEARVVSPIAIIVVAFAEIAGYILPSQDLGAAVRLLRLGLVMAAILGGLFGVGAGLCLLLLHLAKLDSFGVNYTAPLSDGEPFPLTRLLVRKPKPLIKFRDPELNCQDKRRQK